LPAMSAKREQTVYLESSFAKALSRRWERSHPACDEREARTTASLESFLAKALSRLWRLQAGCLRSQP